MSDRIVPGDLVVVIAGCCTDTNIGLTFIAGPFGGNYGRCRNCGKITEGPRVQVPDGAYVRVSRLKKINPPAVKDSTETDKEIPCLT